MPATTTVIIERDRELGTLTQSIAAAADGQGHLVLIDGPAGIGKTQLMAELRTSAAPSMTVRWARASELERDYPFGVVRQLFEALLTDPGQRAAVLAGAATAAEAVFGVAAPGDSGPESGSFATLHGLYWLSLNLAEQQPLLLAVDDIQWADRESLRFLAYLTHRLDGEGILVAATRRSSDPGTDPALLADIAHDPQAVLLHPRPLSAFAVRDLVRARLGADADPSFCDECHVATGGNPLLLRQLLTALEADGVQPRASQTTLVGDIGARAVSRSVIPRLSRLPDRRGRSRGPSPSWAGVPGCRRSRRWPGSASRTSRRPPRSWPGPRSWTGTRRCGSCIPWSGTRSTTSSPPPSGNSSTPARPPCCATPAPTKTRSPPSCSRPRPAARSGWPACCTGPGWSQAQERRRQRGGLPAPRAGRAAAGAGPGPGAG